MYLDKLESEGTKIRDLASKYLAKKYNLPSNMVWCFVMNESRKDDAYIFDVSFMQKGGLVKTRHLFEDFGYLGSDDIDNETSPEEGWIEAINFEWIKMVYLSLSDVSKALAKEYIKRRNII